MSPESKRRLEIVLQIVDDWWGGLVPTDGSTEEEITETERRLGITLPPTMRYWYLVANNLSNRISCFGKPDFIYSLKELNVVNEFLVFAMENQDCWIACIHLKNLDQDDPEIIFYDEYFLRENAESLDFDEPTLLYNKMNFSEFLVNEAIFAAGGTCQFQSYGNMDENVIKFVESESKLLYQSNSVGELWQNESFIIWISSKPRGRLGSIFFSTNHKINLDRIVVLTKGETSQSWRYIHRDEHWAHYLNDACNDLVLPYGENKFPECHLNSPWPRLKHITHHTDENGNEYHSF